MKLTRRAVLQNGIAAGAGFAIAFRLPENLEAAASADFEPNAYLRIAPDDTITFWITRSEMGQGVRTLLAAVLAEELDVELAAVKLEQAMPGARFKGIRLRTSGSGSSTGTFLALRRAGAAAREMLVSAAAQAWTVDRAACRAELGSVVHMPTARRLRYGALAGLAARQSLPTAPKLKDRKDFRLIGKPLKRLDAPAIVRGEAVYGFDVRVPGMLVAVMQRCPYLGGKLSRFDGRKAQAVDGVRYVAPIRSGIFSGVAVVADNTWAAMKGREALVVEWDRGPHFNFDSGGFIESLHRAAAQEGYPIRSEGNAAGVAGNRLDAVYEFPFQAHAPLETMNCTADVRPDSCEVWAPTQTPETALQNIVAALVLPAEAVKVHTTLLGGGFGRRLFVDYVDEAVELSRKIGKPVQLIWTRDDDMRNGFFHPASVEHMSAVLGAGHVLAWFHKSVGSDLSMFGLPTAEQKKDRQRYAKDESPWGAFDNPYSFPAMKVDYVPVDSPVPTGAWRAVEYPSRVFARESFLDEIAHALGQDPLQFRIDLLQPGDLLKLGNQSIDRGRLIRVLEEARERSGWNRPLTRANAADRLVGRGIALNVYDAGSYMAQVAEVSVARDYGPGDPSGIRVHRIVCVLDCGLALNPAGIEGQVESGITWGLSATLHGKIDFRNGRAVQSGFHDFRVARMDEMPPIETHILPGSFGASGFGEHAVPPVAPAVANAIFAATGKRPRRLPVTAGDWGRG